MRLSSFTFKREAGWLMIFSLGLPAIGLLLLFIAWLVHSWF